MQILHINTNDLRGGAAKVMDRLILSQKNIGMESNALVSQKESNMDYTFPFDSLTMPDLEKVCINEGIIDYQHLGGYELINNPMFQKADVIHLHNIHGSYFNPYALSVLSHFKPIVWTLHDMQSVTGHCSYSYKCDKWLTGCGNCPNLTEYPAVNVDRTNLNWLEKLEIYKKSKLYIVPVAQWIGDIAKQGILNNQLMQTILNGVDIEIYKPMDKNVLRQKYGIPTNKIIIGAVANGGTFGAERKGGKYVQAVMDRLIEAGYDVLLVNVGGSEKGYESKCLYNVGYISTEEEMAEVYNTFDIYLFPSTADTCPLVISEAMACGVPIVTFATGGIPELVQHGETGLVAPYEDVKTLYNFTEQLVVDAQLRISFASKAREYCVKHFDHNLIVQKYNAVYEDAIDIFEKRKGDILYFDLDKVSSIVKETEQFKTSEQLKGHTLTNHNNISQQLYVITNENQGSQNFKTIRPELAEKMKFAKNDIIYISKSNYSKYDEFFSTMLYKGLHTDILVSPVVLKRKNFKSFFKPVSPINGNKVDTSMEGIFYSGEFFNLNVKKILNEEQIKFNSVEQFNTELVEISLDKYILNKIKEPIYIYGAGTHTIELLNECEALHVHIKGVIDRNVNLHGKLLLNSYKIYSLEDIDDSSPILISSATFEKEIYDQLENQVKNPLVKIYNN